jgi:glycerol-3-phosphate dehydrogenase
LVDTLREKDNSKQGKSLQLTKGIHLVVDQSRFPLNQAVYFDTPDGRMVFAIPRDGKTYVGTTDTVYKGDIAHPRMTADDRKYVINAINYMFPSLNITVKDIESSWAGLRPLIHEDGKDPSEISRKDEIWTSDSGLITIAGGKLTGYRKMAEIVVDLLVNKLKGEDGRTFADCITKTLPISGGNVGGSKKFPTFIEEKVKIGTKLGLSREEAEKLVKRYGSNVDKVFKYSNIHMENVLEKEMPLFVYLQLIYAIKEEMTTKPIDFFYRRTGTLLFDMKWATEWKDKVVTYMAAALDWTAEQKDTYQKELEKQLQDAFTALDEKKKEKVS